MSEGAWIFLSHSHKDFDKVVKVRDCLEGLHHHPLLFFLKCLDDDAEIDDLIRREIDARSWFVLCDSANSRASTWVQSEIEIIKALSDKTYTVVDLDDKVRSLQSQLFAIDHKASVFLCYSRLDREAARAIAEALRANDFGVFSDLESLLSGEKWAERIGEEIRKVATEGAVIVLLSERSFIYEEQYLFWELRQALSAIPIGDGRAHILLIYLDGFPGTPPLPPELARFQGIDFSQNNFETNMQTLMKTLRNFDWRPR